jgi:plastocyanin
MSLPEVLAVGVTAVALLGACGGSDSDGSNGEPAATTTTTAPTTTRPSADAVTVKLFQFMPLELTVRAGTKVTWTNQDQILHTATAGAAPGTADGKFDGPMDGAGQSFSFTFDQPGTYPYFCTRHNSMTGRIVVQ